MECVKTIQALYMLWFSENLHRTPASIFRAIHRWVFSGLSFPYYNNHPVPPTLLTEQGTMKFYGYNKCGTCRKAQKFLDAKKTA